MATTEGLVPHLPTALSGHHELYSPRNCIVYLSKSAGSWQSSQLLCRMITAEELYHEAEAKSAAADALIKAAHTLEENGRHWAPRVKMLQAADLLEEARTLRERALTCGGQDRGEQAMHRSSISCLRNILCLEVLALLHAASRLVRLKQNHHMQAYAASAP